MDLARRLKERRKKLGLSQAELAEKVDVSQPTIANWERGGHVPRQEALNRIASVLDTDPSWLLAGELPAWKNPAHMHLAKPIHHIPVYEWPVGTKDPTETQPARYITVAENVTNIFALSAVSSSGFPAGTTLVFSKSNTDVPGRFLCMGANEFSLKECSTLGDNIFARLIYSIVPH